MGHEIISSEITVTQNTHKFFCDECNEFLGETTEYEDGYYNELGKYDQNIYVYSHGKFSSDSSQKSNPGWFILNQCLCKSCSENKTKKIIEVLTELGFNPDKT